jgi:hypothetical protein
MSQHKDQTRVQSVLLPLITDKVLAEGDDAAVRDCTLLNRILVQGPDPLYLMETAPTWMFADLCTALDLTVEQGRDAIESAHWQGPGCLLEGKGLPERQESYVDMPVAWRKEALWLVLASFSDCTEEGYGEEVSFQTRLRRANGAVSKMARFVRPGRTLFDVMSEAEGSLRRFLAETPWRTCETFGVPLADGDQSFYVGFKQGHSVVAATSGSLTFYGTMPSTTLRAEGITVDKEISPSFGVVFKKE